jgi:hypothetical protein
MSMFRSSILHLMPPQLFERVDKWTYEPRSNFNHKKNIFIFMHSHTKPKNTFPASYLLYFIVIYFIVYHIYFTYIQTLCLTTTWWSWGHKTKKLFLGCLTKNEESFFDCSPRVWYKPWVSSWEKFTLDTTLCSWSSNELTPYLVSSRLFSSAVAGE